MDLLDELRKLIKQFDEQHIEYALCGGLAMAVYALPRATLDIDVLIEDASISKVKETVNKLGYVFEASPMFLHGGKIVIHRFTKIDSTSRQYMALDLLVVTQEVRQAWEERARITWEGGSLKVVSPKGLILLKSFRRSGQDEDDIKYLQGLINEN